LVNLIPRFYDASDGKVQVFGRDVRSYTPDALREQIAIVPQKAVLFKGTIRSNLLWGNPNATEDALWEALERAQAKDFVLAKEGGLDAPVSQSGKNFSGGQRQRLTIARALVRKAPILILDDSSSALDYATDAALRRALRSLPENPTVFLISQRTSSIRHADRILVLEDGEAVGLGTHTELLKGCEVYREIHESQYRREVEEA
jgi:ABC-type multidrug transport system fused ATPase/permease subunit